MTVWCGRDANCLYRSKLVVFQIKVCHLFSGKIHSLQSSRPFCQLFKRNCSLTMGKSLFPTRTPWTISVRTNKTLNLNCDYYVLPTTQQWHACRALLGIEYQIWLKPSNRSSVFLLGYNFNLVSYIPVPRDLLLFQRAKEGNGLVFPALTDLLTDQQM